MKIFGKELKLLILDVDGVILKLNPNFQKNMEQAAREMGLPLEPILDFITRLSEGEKAQHPRFRQNIALMWPLLSDNEITEYHNRFRTWDRKNPYPAVPGAVDTIQFFRNHGVPVALCTSNQMDELLRKLYKAGIDPLWFKYINANDSGFIKPDPRALTVITDTLGIEKENTLFVGDWYPDIEAARAADTTFIACYSGGIPHHAFIREGVPENRIIDSLANLPELIDLTPSSS